MVDVVALKAAVPCDLASHLDFFNSTTNVWKQLSYYLGPLSIMTSQASGMPPVIAYKLLRRTEKFPSEIPCFFVWARLVYFELADAGLISIIRTDLSKPQVNDPNYAQWSFLSLRVGKWLKNNVDQEVRDKLTLPSYADDVMKAIGVLYPIRRGNPDTETDNSERKIRNLPPRDMYPSVYARTWCDQAGHTSPNGNCMYCDGDDHNARRCPYLNVGERPKNWDPSPGLWYLGMPYAHGLSYGLLRWVCSNSLAGMGSGLESSSNTNTCTPETTDTASEPATESTNITSAPSIESEGSTSDGSVSEDPQDSYSEYSEYSGSEDSDSESSDSSDPGSVYYDAPTHPRKSPMSSICSTVMELLRTWCGRW